MSYDEIVVLSSKAHTEFRIPLESPKIYDHQVNDPVDVLLHAENEVKLPQGSYAPRILGKVNGVNTHLILDTGCTPCVVSLNKLKNIGVGSRIVRLPHNANGGMMVGDGRKVASNGLIHNLKVEVLPGHTIKIDAYVLDVPVGSYEFLFGRIAMAKAGISANMGSSSWLISDGDVYKPLNVLHTDPYKDSDTLSCNIATLVVEVNPRVQAKRLYSTSFLIK